MKFKEFFKTTVGMKAKNETNPAKAAVDTKPAEKEPPKVKEKKPDHKPNPKVTKT